MFKKILIANRGEIACRVAATARRLGIRTVAVYSDADAGARHVRACDEAVHIGASAPRESYLLAQRVLEAARATGAEAVHPGYGFLSENEHFARACAEAGIAFIGPPASAIAAMGSKAAAKALMEKAGVPLVPGYHGERQEPDFLKAEAGRIGYPVLIKASAGGGGKGMRLVQQAEEFEAALASCKREAAASFGDDHVLVERYVTRPRHIEIQVFGDSHGECVYLFERDCSVQRRHQKVLEEAPAPGMTPERRAEMGEAAVAAARAVAYVGAGTVEFIAEQDGRFYFMEMNTRLQVEHPVTEAITGHDLVEWQLRVAAGEPLPARQHELRLHGHAIEARLCAENPEAQFLPATGRLRVFRAPAAAAEFAVAPVRIDAGVREGDEISPWYDSMIAKLIVWGEDRAQALARLDAALAETHIVGLHTNVAFLRRVVASRSFAQADLDTALIEREREALFGQPGLPLEGALAGVAARLLQEEAATQTTDPWSRRDGWRLHGVARRRLEVLDAAGQRHVASLEYLHDGSHLVELAGQRLPLRAGPLGADRYDVRLGERRWTLSVYRHGDGFAVFGPQGSASLQWLDAIAHAGEGGHDAGRLTAPMPGKLIALHVQAGQSVRKGQALAVMEAMKMEHSIAAPADGIVDVVLYRVGDQLAEGAELLRLKTA
ncbi:acetyl/propionyl/methylcrotonyl-CoA carboxylase subunit alpha [Aquabacterium sp. A7-Y]|uniref:acetyl/propionyl/methylcrotonyl-CoA carboxylase subunit alpha n=1 Tax=Aquabacterium sp. A7-Y TaxID=1349605 RepID=UPI00223C9C5C|nr:acetyl/propionyl/methylcrotonyl-CoA carboxylase subunit alpha [Aquabacterium sp. A7-Y]MCW7537236.1 acetyl/propionyl/methylcrotonyl-CoA carboxylase subunit alpha [Aquabacterium sp. A7-Y]